MLIFVDYYPETWILFIFVDYYSETWQLFVFVDYYPETSQESLQVYYFRDPWTWCQGKNKYLVGRLT